MVAEYGRTGEKHRESAEGFKKELSGSYTINQVCQAKFCVCGPRVNFWSKRVLSWFCECVCVVPNIFVYITVVRRRREHVTTWCSLEICCWAAAETQSILRPKLCREQPPPKPFALLRSLLPLSASLNRRHA